MWREKERGEGRDRKRKKINKGNFMTAVSG